MWSCRVCVGVVFLFAVRMVAKPYHLRVNWPTTYCEIKDGVHFFTLNLECRNRYKKLLLCNSENSDIAWWNQNNSECFFSVFFEKRTKSCFFSKTQRKRFFFFLKKKPGGLFFFEKTRVFLNPGYNALFLWEHLCAPGGAERRVVTADTLQRYTRTHLCRFR